MNERDKISLDTIHNVLKNVINKRYTRDHRYGGIKFAPIYYIKNKYKVHKYNGIEYISYSDYLDLMARLQIGRLI